MNIRAEIYIEIEKAAMSLPYSSISEIIRYVYELKWNHGSVGQYIYSRAKRNVPALSKLTDSELLECLKFYNKVRDETKIDRSAS